MTDNRNTVHTPNPDALDWDAAIAGLDLLEDADGTVIDGPVDLLIERLLDQLDIRGRLAFEGEDIFFRRAIGSYRANELTAACGNACWAAQQGSTLLLYSGLDDPDRSVSLRDALAQARIERGSSRREEIEHKKVKEG